VTVSVLWVATLLAALAPVTTHAESYGSLEPFLVDLPGWNAAGPGGSETQAMGATALTVFRTYARGRGVLQASILVGALAGMSWLPEYAEGYRREGLHAVEEVERIRGFLVYTMFRTDTFSGVVVVLLETPAEKPNRGAVLAISFEGVDLAAALDEARLFDWAAIKAEITTIP
jgi:hypothetical protein